MMHEKLTVALFTLIETLLTLLQKKLVECVYCWIASDSQNFFNVKGLREQIDAAKLYLYLYHQKVNFYYFSLAIFSETYTTQHIYIYI